jgi:hypothetical protein
MKATKTTLLIFILLSGFWLPVVSQKSITDNKIKSITVLEEKPDMLVKRQFKESETYFDLRGNVIEEIIYKEGKVKKHFKYQYDTDNNKIREEEYDQAGRIVESSEYKYENGLRIEKILYNTDKKIKSRKTYQYTTF